MVGNRAAVYTGSRNLYPDMVTSAKSLLINSNVDEIFFLIEDDEFPFELPSCIKTIDVRNQKFFREDSPNMNSRYTYLAMMRAALAFVFPNHDRILSLDTDTIIDNDISDIWDLPLEDSYYFSASKEAHRSYAELLYTNMGVTLFNLAKLRDGKAKEVIDVLNIRRYNWVEQDVFNYLCQGRILEMPSSYNVNTWTEPTDDQKILHFAGIKDWQTSAFYLKYQGIPFADIRRAQA